MKDVLAAENSHLSVPGDPLPSQGSSCRKSVGGGALSPSKASTNSWERLDYVGRKRACALSSGRYQVQRARSRKQALVTPPLHSQPCCFHEKNQEQGLHHSFLTGYRKECEGDVWMKLNLPKVSHQSRIRRVLIQPESASPPPVQFAGPIYDVATGIPLGGPPSQDARLWSGRPPFG